ncbi:MAG: patatin-like phospholipase family protein [Actinomycetota bacterium]|nr:patatin-like phospholipase family protein [Actinomycetota bacterium]
MSSAERSIRRGLVLGGGGVLGGAWAVGALSALKQVHGFEPRDADFIVGTSAGSVLASLLGAGATVEELAAQERGEKVQTGPIAGFTWDIAAVTGGSRPGRPKLEPGSRALMRTGLNRFRMRRMPPTAFLSAFLPTGSKTLDRVAHLVEGFTPIGEWSPHENVWIVTMDYASGTRVVFGQPTAPPAPLSLAVQASCSIPAWYSPVEIGGRRYVDGGAWSATSVDLLADMGLDEVYVIAPMVSFHMDRPDHLLARLERTWRVQVTKRCLSEVEKVRASGTDVTVLGPGAEDLAAIGGNLMDFEKRIHVLETSVRTSIEALRDPDHMGPDHLASVG